MSFNHGSKRPTITDASTLPPSIVNQQPQELSPKHVPPSPRELQRFMERKRYQELGYELPMNSKEAAAYIGYHQKRSSVWRAMEKSPRIPLHVRRKTWKFYASELD